MKLTKHRNGSRQRRRFSAQQIQQYLDDFARSGLSAAAFAREHGLCYSAFCRWRRRAGMQRRATVRPPQPPRLQAVDLDSLLRPAWAAEIALPHGATLRLQTHVAPTWAAKLIETLQRSC